MIRAPISPNRPRRAPIILGARPGEKRREVGGPPGTNPQPVTSREAQMRAQGDVFGTGAATRPTEAPGLLTGLGRVAELLMAYRGQASQERQAEAERTREQKQEEAQRSAWADALASFQGGGGASGAANALGAVDPEAALSMLLENQPEQPDWNVGSGYTHAFRVGPQGDVQLGGEMPLRPRAPPRAPTGAPELPPGFVWSD